ncbi:phosphoglycolate phosphatase [Idiomarina fontislapidosi]|uniref:Phosphoglycolate phosphatase n=1 Tax=Idiomarina fontislapidosi TaxID=263723 RepID=A0A432Y9L2_9GAMM|nr:HAD-IA family hydrolase [Idiomarina fontislapidosi]PYE34418.1 phosphoglycolate phosphatase [Idiomarina fontislapidosi]RUO57623.1 phosphoglycolate phosphatase [Idiomarina fontislapidosi]
MNTHPVAAVLFDLDGTLLDSAPDLGFALNEVCRENNLPEIPAEVFTPVASHGSRGLLSLTQLDDDTLLTLKPRFLEIYRENLARYSRLFDGIELLLSNLRRHQIKIGIVTNKPEFLTHPLIAQFEALQSISVVVCGDTLEVAKPSPKPLYYAAEQLDVDPKDCIYVGDAERDIIAGRDAGMVTVLAEYGYISSNDQPQQWLADYTIERPDALLELLALSEYTD